jgi:catechol-2,3-dioxygenase
MPDLTGISHLSLSVSDRDASVRWYEEVLGFSVISQMDEERWKRSISLHASGILISFTQHRELLPFDYHHIGLDHVSFGVSDRATLEEWQRRFAELGVTHSPIEETDIASVLSFKDPDGIALEVFHLPS